MGSSNGSFFEAVKVMKNRVAQRTTWEQTCQMSLHFHTFAAG
jgi:hypothetical protein